MGIGIGMGWFWLNWGPWFLTDCLAVCVGGCIWVSEKETLRLRVKGVVDEGGMCGLADRGAGGESVEQRMREFAGYGWTTGG
jgi:hypothetical protein